MAIEDEVKKKKMSVGKKILIGLGIYFGIGIYSGLLYAFPIPAFILGIIIVILLVKFFHRNKNQESVVFEIQKKENFFKENTTDFIETAKIKAPTPKLSESEKEELKQRLIAKKNSQMDIEDVVMQNLEKRIDKAVPDTKHYTLVYEDFNGNETRREIDLQGFLYENDKLYIIAWCYLRNDQRQFAVNRIIQLYDRNGTEIIAPETYFENMYHETDEYKVSAFFEVHFDELMPLIFLARADGAMRKNEREAITSYIKNILPNVSDAVLEKYIKLLKCEFEQFGKSLKVLKGKPTEIKAAVLAITEQMYASKKTPDPMETATFEKIKLVLQ